ncbi:hypothetical protein OIU84_015492 [Salix udensis]|uniref:Uncharacterized protein n=1 Tax=Salix udensis TaxID=889485 RepID=A0AAD6J6L3_9ROSI|nr:hypothetical protein OIU84_015492 [Salix udensis]
MNLDELWFFSFGWILVLIRLGGEEILLVFFGFIFLGGVLQPSSCSWELLSLLWVAVQLGWKLPLSFILVLDRLGSCAVVLSFFLFVPALACCVHGMHGRGPLCAGS